MINIGWNFGLEIVWGNAYKNLKRKCTPFIFYDLDIGWNFWNAYKYFKRKCTPFIIFL